MPSYRQPGVYIDRTNAGPAAIQPAPTATPVFIGCCNRGPSGEMHAVGSRAAAEMLYGLPQAPGRGAGELYRTALPWTLHAWFANGGGEAHVVRVNTRADGGPDSAGYAAALAELQTQDDGQVLLFPGLIWDGDSGQAILAGAVAHCEQRGDRMVLIDLPPGRRLAGAADIHALKLTASSFAASYYPWPRMHHSEAPRKGIPVSPAAFAAAVWARSDEDAGVWTAAAGPRAQLHGVTALEYDVSGAELGTLTQRGINALRHLPGHGHLIWGARTLASRADPEWRYLPVRRTALFLEKSIDQGTEWAVFEENTPTLWTRVTASVESFMNGLYREGAFQGARASEAYFVRCGLGQTMTQVDIERGRLVLEVGFAPLRPAEFVVLRWERELPAK